MPEIVRTQPWAARGPHVAPDGTTRRPPGMVVSMCSCTDLNPTSLASNSPMVSIRCDNDRPSRSNRHTTNVSPAPS